MLNLNARQAFLTLNPAALLYIFQINCKWFKTHTVNSSWNNETRTSLRFKVDMLCSVEGIGQHPLKKTF